MTKQSDDPFSRLRELKLDDFEPLVGAVFQLQREGTESAELQLLEARDLAVEGRPHGPRRPFSLLFRGPGEFRLAQGTYTLETEKMPPLPLFLVPVGPRGGGECYEAVFH